MTTFKAPPSDPAALGRATLLVHGTRGEVWPDDTTPRTDDPVYFNTMTAAAGKRPYIHRASDN